MSSNVSLPPDASARAAQLAEMHRRNEVAKPESTPRHKETRFSANGTGSKQPR